MGENQLFDNSKEKSRQNVLGDMRDFGYNSNIIENVKPVYYDISCKITQRPTSATKDNISDFPSQLKALLNKIHIVQIYLRNL